MDEPSPPRGEGTDPARSRRAWVLPLVIFVVALALRAAYLAEASQQPDFERPLVDAGYHDFWAWGMVSGDWTPPTGTVDPDIPGTPYFRPPLTTFWLAAIYSVLGRDYLGARVVQILLGSLSCVLAGSLAGRLFGRATGAIAGLLAATYWVLVYFDTEYREVSLLAFLYLAFVTALLRWRDRPRGGWSAVAGLALGLSVLAKPNGVLLTPLAAVWMPWAARGGAPRGRALAHAGLLAVVVAACVVPVTVRNAVAAGDAVLVSSNGGINAYIGNNPTTTGVSVALPEGVPPFDSAFDYPDVVRWVEEQEGRPLKHSEVSAWFARRAFDHAVAEPGRTLARYAKKALAFWAGVEIVSEKDLVFAREESIALRIVPLGFPAVLAAAVVGLALAIGALRSRPGRNGLERAGILLVAGVVGVYALSFVPFFVTGRYRAPIVPLLLAFSAYAVWRLFAAARAGRWSTVGIGVAAMALVYAVDRVPVPGYERDPAETLLRRGAQLALEGRLDEAEPLLRRAVEQSPRNAQAHNNLGLFLLQAGRPQEAIEVLRVAVGLDDGNYRAHQNLGLALIGARRFGPAAPRLARARALQPRDPALPLEAGIAYQDAGQPALAREQLAAALATDPDLLEARDRLGTLCLGIGDFAAAVEHLRRATELAPGNAGLLSNLGLAHVRSGNLREALRCFEAAERLDPTNPTIRQNVITARRKLEEGGP